MEVNREREKMQGEEERMMAGYKKSRKKRTRKK